MVSLKIEPAYRARQGTKPLGGRERMCRRWLPTCFRLFGVFAMAICQSASAADLPMFDVMKYCKSSLAVAAKETRDTLMSQCKETEGKSLEKMKKIWGKLPNDIQDSCSQQTNVTGEGSYSVLASCVASLYGTRWVDQGGVVK